MVVFNQSARETEISFGEVQGVIAICPNCKDKDLKVRTIRKKHSKYYYCKNCGKSSSKPIQLTKEEEQIKVVCCFCETDMVRKGKNRNKKQRYYCSECDRYSIKAKVLKQRLEQLIEIACMKCKGSKLKKKGFDRYGKQIYYCCSCQKHSLVVKASLYPRFVPSV